MLVPVEADGLFLEILGIFLTGTLAGFLGALVGIGGGVLMVPALTLLFQVPMHQAITSSLVGVIATSAMGATAYLKRGMVNLRLAYLLETTTVAGAVAGGLLSASLGGPTLQILFSILLLVTGFNLIRRQLGVQPADAREEIAATGDTPWQSILAGAYHDPREQREIRYRAGHLPAGLLGSIGAGALSGMLGVGGGLIKVPILTYMGLPVKAATATSNYMIGITAGAAALVYLGRGMIVAGTAAPVAAGVLLGARLGALLQPHLRSKTLLWILVAVLAAAAVNMGWEALLEVLS